MEKRLEFLDEALVEFDDSFSYYVKRSLDAAAGFAGELDESLDQVAESPQRFQRTYADCRQCALRRYPYFVI